MAAQTSQESLDRAVLGTGIPDGSRILIAVSGGPDSVALLETLSGLVERKRVRWQLRVGHVNHGLRGEESDRDEEFVRALAGSLALAFDVARVDTMARARERGLSQEAAARELRYASLRRMLYEWQGDVIATGHTQDDQAETFLLHLLRGAGLRGLGGMAQVGADLVRPFLGVPRATILMTLQGRHLGFRLDTSNRDERHRRNLIRRRLIPDLQSIQPAVVPVLARSASLLRTDADFIGTQAQRTRHSIDLAIRDGEVGASTPAWCALHPALQRAVLRDMIELLLGGLVDVEEEHISVLADTLRFCAQTARADQLPHGLALYVDENRFALRVGPRAEFDPMEPVEVVVPGRSIAEVGALEASVTTELDRESLERAIAVCGPYTALCDADAIGSTLLVRSRHPGDRVRPLGMSGTRKLQDVLVDHKIPRHLRNRIPVIQSGDRIVWIPGIALDARSAVSPATARVAQLHWQPYGPLHRATMPRYFAP